MKNNFIKFIILIFILLIVPDIIMLLPLPRRIGGSHILWVMSYYFLKILFVEVGIIWLFKKCIFKDN